MPRFSTAIPVPSPELEPLYNAIVQKYGVTAGRVALRLIEAEPERCSIWELRECAQAKGDDVLRAIRLLILDDEVRERLRRFIKLAGMNPDSQRQGGLRPAQYDELPQRRTKGG